MDAHITKQPTRTMEMVMVMVRLQAMGLMEKMTSPYQDSNFGSSSLPCCLLFHSEENSTFD
jgi:hypothetical protein